MTNLEQAILDYIRANGPQTPTALRLALWPPEASPAKFGQHLRGLHEAGTLQELKTGEFDRTWEHQTHTQYVFTAFTGDPEVNASVVIRTKDHMTCDVVIVDQGRHLLDWSALFTRDPAPAIRKAVRENRMYEVCAILNKACTWDAGRFSEQVVLP